MRFPKFSSRRWNSSASLKLPSCEAVSLRFELPDAPPGILNTPKRQASHQSDSPDQHRHTQPDS